jgi:hypothetical protein
MGRSPRGTGPLLAGCCLAVMGALLVVGVMSHGVLRHVAQTAPLWPRDARKPIRLSDTP